MKMFGSVAAAADWIEADLGKKMSICTPLGLGKPNLLLNELYARTKKDASKHLKIFTALSLNIPKAKTDIEKRFLDPFKERHFGKDYPELQYAADVAANRLAANVNVYEFYFQAGSALSKFPLQSNYISLNYTHVVQSVLEHEVQMLVCIIAKNPKTGKTYSLSCNPDLTLDVVDVYQQKGKHIKIVGVVHSGLPFMSEDAEVNPDFFDAIVESDEESAHELFALPREPVSVADFMIGLQASLLVEDGGTIQVGIGSLSDALVYCLVLRQKQNALYREITDLLIRERLSTNRIQAAGSTREFHQGTFVEGLYGTSEMVMDAFMHLRKAGILVREINDSDDQVKRYLHGGFFLGSKPFYQWMRERFTEGDTGLCMTRVSKVNDLYDPHEQAIRRQRVKARFFNIAMKATLLGGVASDTLDNGQVVSGVGGQYNFVAMSHELPDSHSVIMLRSTHSGKKGFEPNIVWAHDQLTIPRHLRDVVITEYGMAFTRACTDEEVIQSMIELAASNDQPALMATAVKNGKLNPRFKLKSPSANHAEKLEEFLKTYTEKGFFSAFPFGSDFTAVEENLAINLGKLQEKQNKKSAMIGLFFKGFSTSPSDYAEELTRMNYQKPKNLTEWFYQKLLLGQLSAGCLKKNS